MNEINASVQLEGRLGMCSSECASTGAGHRVLAVQAIVAAASPSGFRDAVVTAIEPQGTMLLVDLRGDSLRVWHHEPADVSVGEPVAVHQAAGLLAIGDRRISIR